jgi:hypothetical protein
MLFILHALLILAKDPLIGRLGESIRQSDGTFDGKNIVLWTTPLDTEHPGRKTVARAHLEDDGRVLLHRHFLINEKGEERLMIEFRLTRK